TLRMGSLVALLRYLYVTSSPSGGGKVTVQRCKPGQFACQHSDQCVSVSVLCDGRLDCKDHSDEINCGRNYNVCAAVMHLLYYLLWEVPCRNFGWSLILK
uniref:Uncharacterized protein n=1 Tax=Seriola dumerili TaxID=41447 RepID=A0A3B4TCX3_SERDU